ncbi:MAG: hypothetical protein WBV74_20975 [Pseudonocardiaceae bacterium]
MLVTDGAGQLDAQRHERDGGVIKPPAAVPSALTASGWERTD